jgi:hypothetical protein
VSLQAIRAAYSSDPATATNGAALAGVIRALIFDEQTLVISVEDVGRRNRRANKGNGTSPCHRLPFVCGNNRGTGDYGIIVDPKADHGRGIGADVRLVHELGHAYAYMVEGLTDNKEDDRAHNYRAVEVENDYGEVKGCTLRRFHAVHGEAC